MALQISITTKIGKDLEAAIKKDYQGVATQQARIEAIEFGNIIRKKMTGLGRGRLYRRGNTTHRASRAPNDPKTDTGAYRRSIGHQIRLSGGEVVVGAGVRYAAWLEEGTRNMQARPMWQRTLREEQDGIINRIKNAIEGAM